MHRTDALVLSVAGVLAAVSLLLTALLKLTEERA